RLAGFEHPLAGAGELHRRHRYLPRPGPARRALGHGRDDPLTAHQEDTAMGPLPAPARPDRDTRTGGFDVDRLSADATAAVPAAPTLLDRRRLFGVAAVAAAALLGGTGSLLAPEAAAAAGTRIITTANLNVRASAGTGGRRLGTLPRGTTVTATGRASNGWYRISYRGRTGYVSNRYAKVVAPKKAAPKTTPVSVRVQTLAGLNVRSSASASGPRLGTLSKGA